MNEYSRRRGQAIRSRGTVKASPEVVRISKATIAIKTRFSENFLSNFA